MRLWIEQAHQEQMQTEAGVGGNAVSTLQTKERFFAILVSCPQAGPAGGDWANQIADQAAAMLAQDETLDAVVKVVLPTLPKGEHIVFSVLQVFRGCEAQLVECDAPPLFLIRRGKRVALPLLEDVAYGRLVRQGRFSLQNGDYLALVSESYIRTKGWGRRWGWRDIALAIRRLTETGGDAEQLLGALTRTYYRLAGKEAEQEIAVVAMRVRPLRSATVWSGPPADPAQDPLALEKLMAGPGKRIICGDTTADIAARLLGIELEMESRPKDGWAEVPPVSLLEGMDLVTEGVVTLRKARERLAGARCVRDLPRAEDGATRLARILLEVDVIRFIVGMAVNPSQTVDGAGKIPWRQGAIEELVSDLQAGGKIVSVEHV